MEQLYSIEKIVGKTIAYVDEYGYAPFIKFTDGSFITFCSYDSSETVWVSDSKINKVADIWDYQEQFERGFIDEKERNRLHNAKITRQEKMALVTQQQEIETLKKLKAKYPNV